MNNKRTDIDDYELLCLCVEGGVATSTPEYIQSIIDEYNGKYDIRSLSLVKRLENIKKLATHQHEKKQRQN